MRTSDHTALNTTNTTETTISLRYTPAVKGRQRLSWREARLLLAYHLRLLNWWLLLLMLFGFLGFALLAWLQVRGGTAQGGLSRADDLSRFVMEPGAALFAALLSSSLIVGDPLLEVLMATRAGLYAVVIWRFVPTFCTLLVCSAAYLCWSLGSGVSYAHQQGPLRLLLLWLAPVLLMSMLGLFGALITRNAALGMVIAIAPLAASLFFYNVLLPMQAAHPFLITYTFSGSQNASDWWVNRLTLLGIGLAFAAWNWWLLRREERLLHTTG